MLLCIWTSFSVTRSLIDSNAEAATNATDVERRSLFDIIKHRRYVDDLYNSVSQNPGKLKNLVAADFRKMFDEPELKRREGNLTIWQYRSDRCVLDIYFKDNSKKPFDYILHHRDTAFFMGGSAIVEELSDGDCLQTIISM